MTAEVLYLPPEPARILCNIRSGIAGILMWLTPSSAGESMCHGSPRSVDHRPRDRAAFPYRTHVCEVVKAGVQPSLAGACTPQQEGAPLFSGCVIVVPSKQPGATDAREGRLWYGSGLLSLVADRHSPRSPFAGNVRVALAVIVNLEHWDSEVPVRR
jgi:hypothetical protein